MRKRYVVMLNSETNEQVNALTEWIKENNFGWWHWLNNSWLLSDGSGKSSSAEIRDKVLDIFPGVDCIVLEIRGDGSNDTWSGFGPSTDEKDMFKWIKTNWGNK